MPHSTSHSTGAGSTSHIRATSHTRSSHSRSSSTVRPNAETNGGAGQETEKFPDFDVGHVFPSGQSTGGSRWQNGFGNGGATNSSDRWHARRDSRVKWAPTGPPSGAFGHTRKASSINNAIHRMRSGSMSQNAHKIADALHAPFSWKLVVLCIGWYWSSALTNTSSKTILTAFDKPATLTLVQFGFVCSYCLLLSWLASIFPRLRTAIPALKYPIRYPSRDVIKTTLPLAAFQIGGHLLSSNATSKIPVSLVHTIKGLSPLFTVLAYRFIFDIRYPKATYLSLVPLTCGVMLACSGNRSFGGQYLGIIYAFFAAMIFVTQNIFSKRLFNEAARAEQDGSQSRKLDKLNLLCYSSGMAFLLTGPIWLWSEGLDIVGDFLWDGSVDLIQSPNSLDHGPLVLEYIFNGTFHFGQNILAFVLLSQVSPVTYSVASLIKRVFVIIIAIFWFRSPTTNMQAAGIGLTFLGLYLYDRSNAKNKADQRARSMTETKRDETLLPLSTKHAAIMHPVLQQNGAVFESPVAMSDPATAGHVYTQGSAAAVAFASNVNVVDPKKSDDAGRAGGRNRGVSNAAWLAPGTRQEDTWRAGDGQPVGPR